MEAWCVTSVAATQPPGKGHSSGLPASPPSVAFDRHKKRSIARHGLSTTGERPGGILEVGNPKTTGGRRHDDQYIARFGGLALVLIAVAAGVLIGRVIEAIAVGAVLFAIWTYVWRLVGAPDDEPSHSQRRPARDEEVGDGARDRLALASATAPFRRSTASASSRKPARCSAFSVRTAPARRRRCASSSTSSTLTLARSRGRASQPPTRRAARGAISPRSAASTRG